MSVPNLSLTGSRDLMINDIPNSKKPLEQYKVPITRLTMQRWNTYVYGLFISDFYSCCSIFWMRASAFAFYLLIM